MLARMPLVKWVLLLCLSGCSCQRDCTGVDCPALGNCIEEVLESGACCAACARTGCACKGYQYYDCVHAGFQDGKVPEGESYFVDFGSTECSCPAGGGKISCHYILCPEIPANCIKTSEPTDGCVQCERVGCVHQEQKYEAGHSFHMDPCQVCHCPNDGGNLMCYPIPDCNAGNVQKPMLTTTTKENAHGGRHGSLQFSTRSQNPGDNLLKPLRLSENENLPLFTRDHFYDDEDYVYLEADLVTPTEPSVISVSVPESSTQHEPFSMGPKQELMERFATHQAEEATEAPTTVQPTTLWPQETTVTLQGHLEGHIPSLESHDTNEGQEDAVTEDEEEGEEEDGMVMTLSPFTNSIRNELSRTSPENSIKFQDSEGQDKTSSSIQGTPSLQSITQSEWAPEHEIGPTVNPVEHSTKSEMTHESRTLSPTSPPLLRVETDKIHPPKTHEHAAKSHKEEDEEEKEEAPHNFLTSLPKSHEVESPAMEEVQQCCEAGQKWATENNHCNHMPVLPEDQHSLCSVVQQQCCTGSLKQSRCLAGMGAARGGETCQAPDGQHCGEDSYQECCSCCSLGLKLQRQGHGCDAHQYFDYPCGHILLTCCEEEGPTLPSLRKKERPRPTVMPKKVGDRKFPKEAFSIEEEREEAANTLEEAKDVDECKRQEGLLCHHTCINTWGSYQCACHPGFELLQDGHSCAPALPEEDNRVIEEDQLVTAAAQTTRMPVVHNLCAGSSRCSQKCSVVGGQPKCSCFPGFSLMADGQTCEDVDECITNTHTCQADERCVNTLGAFACERQVMCSQGFQPRNEVCEDIDECVLRTHNCGVGLECQNTEGSFTCKPKPKCFSGFSQDPHGNCIDINECATLSEACRPGFNCINTVGSYTCQRKIIMCSQGHHSSPDGARCIDVDECQTGVHRCGQGQICQNIPGSYRCDCQTGYQYDSLRQTCVDVNECWRYPGRLCAQTCENTPGSYQCSCTAGFSLAFDGKNCEDINECDNNPCSQECANIYGSYQCYCRQGFYLKEDGHACEDIDECSQSIGHLCAFQCVNVPGSYQCTCPPHGYTMSPNGRTCRDIDECATGAHNCSVSETCYNIQGSFRCLSFSCPANYRKVSDTRCERSCPNFLDCQNLPLRITYYQLSFQTNIIIPAQIFRIGPSPAYAGDNIIISITRGNEDGYFSTRRLNSFTGAVYLQRPVREPRDFLIDVEMKLLRQGTFTTFLARIYVFITASSL
ncbi:fibulin-2 isoform X2 [Denticeps clupeoides]|uniref:EGF-like domain-containing protein n=1 Tax=Denticeps clupeoides TaxID=299321 RepID=A0AAY4EFI2_9TELE|nr:fibulin-2 isoform X2 [Denticeps clupeoides]